MSSPSTARQTRAASTASSPAPTQEHSRRPAQPLVERLYVDAADRRRVSLTLRPTAPDLGDDAAVA